MKENYEYKKATIEDIDELVRTRLLFLGNDGHHFNHHPNQKGQDLNKLIIDFCKEPKSVQEIMDEFDLDSRTSFRRKYLTPIEY